MKRSARRRSEGSNKWLVAAVLLGVLIAAAPIVAGAHSLWVALGLGIGMALLASSLAVFSDSDMDGPPPRRTG